MKLKLTFLLLLTFLFLFSGSIYGSDFTDGWDAYKKKDYKEAVRLFRLSAEQGSAEAQVLLGGMYSRGEGVTVDFKEAEKWMRLSAEQGLAAGQFLLGSFYSSGMGGPVDLKKAIKWLRLSAEQGFADAKKELDHVIKQKNSNNLTSSQLVNDAIHAHLNKDHKKALEIAKPLAEQGNALAQLLLSDLYFNGDGVPQDNKEAVKWLKLSAEQGDADAQLQLGSRQISGKGVTTNEKEGVKMVRLAAEQGKEKAQFILGTAYWLGRGGLLPDLKEAIKWLRLSAEQGNAEAKKTLDLVIKQNNLNTSSLLLQKGSKAYLNKDYKKALEFLKPLVEQEDIKAAYVLGVMYYEGHGVPQDNKEAVTLFRLSAEQGYAGAQYSLGLMYHKGHGIPQDYVSAHMWLNLSGSNGIKVAVKIRDILEKKMTPSQIEEAQRLARNWKPKK